MARPPRHVPSPNPDGTAPRTLIQQLEERTTAMSVKELATLLSVGPNSIYDIIKAGRLPCIRIGTTVRLDPKEVADWLRRCAS